MQFWKKKSYALKPQIWVSVTPAFLNTRSYNGLFHYKEKLCLSAGYAAGRVSTTKAIKGGGTKVGRISGNWYFSKKVRDPPLSFSKELFQNVFVSLNESLGDEQEETFYIFCSFK